MPNNATKIWLWSALLMTGLCGGVLTVAAEDQVVVVADFESGVDHFGAPARRDTTQAAVGTASLYFPASFAMRKSEYFAIGRYLRVRHKRLSAIQFQIRSETVTRVSVQLVDATGQTHQVRLPVETDGQWHQLRIDQFDGHEHWAGAKDGVFHWPARKMLIILPKVAIRDEALEGSIWIDQVEALVAE